MTWYLCNGFFKSDQSLPGGFLGRFLRGILGGILPGGSQEGSQDASRGLPGGFFQAIS